MKKRDKAEKTDPKKGVLSAFLFPENRDNGESCVMCGTAVPEGCTRMPPALSANCMREGYTYAHRCYSRREG